MQHNVAGVNWYLVGGIVLAAVLAAISQWRSERKRTSASAKHGWDAATEALCRQQREKQLAQPLSRRGYNALPTYDEFKQRVNRP